MPPQNTNPSSQPIGVFDSGVGGLTVVSAIRNLLPSENIFYLGDTARVPYGGKSGETIERYSIEISDLLLAEQAKVIVVACNTASALGLPRLKERLKVPVLGVITPGAQAAVRATKNGIVGVIGTRATIASGAYERAIHECNPDIKVIRRPCPLLVPLIEESLLEDALTDQFLQRYLEPLIREGIDTLVLGCTHYPLLKEAIQRVAGNAITLVDSAENCAIAVRELLAQNTTAASASQHGNLQVAFTDATEGFFRVAERNLGLNIGEVQLRTVQN
ncbi:MAG: glutamate racemase [Chthoniobacterales bacterium]